MNKQPTIFVVDDDEAFRASMLELLGAAGHLARGYASTGDFLLDPPGDAPGCILLDVRLPGPSGLDLQAGMRRLGISLPVIFLTGYADITSSVRAMKEGAVDFLEKPVARDVLLAAIERALADDAVRRQARQQARQSSSRLEALSTREREILDRIVEGKLNKQIAGEIGVSLRTVKAYRAQLMIKLGVTSAAELVKLASTQRTPPAH